MAIALAGAFSMLPGCAAPSPDRSAMDVAPLYNLHTGEARSLVSDSPAVRAYSQSTTLQDAYTPWYYDRNDHRLAVRAGFRSPIFQSSFTRTHDSLHSSSHGRVHDHYHQTTRRTRFIEGFD